MALIIVWQLISGVRSLVGDLIHMGSWVSKEYSRLDLGLLEPLVVSLLKTH